MVVGAGVGDTATGTGTGTGTGAEGIVGGCFNVDVGVDVGNGSCWRRDWDRMRAVTDAPAAAEAAATMARDALGMWWACVRGGRDT